MDIRYRINEDDSVVLTKALAAAGEKDAMWFTTGAVSLASLSLAFPFSMSNEGWIRLIAALVLALVMSWVATRLIEAWRSYRTNWFPHEAIQGVEPGERLLSLSLESVRETTQSGERVFRWRSFLDTAETDDFLALQISDRECLVIPRSALSERALAEAETLVSLIGRAGR